MLRLLMFLLVGPRQSAPKPIADAEFDIEGLPVHAVERANDRESNIHWTNTKGKNSDFRLVCAIEKHNQLVARFRYKLKLCVSVEQGHNK